MVIISFIFKSYLFSNISCQALALHGVLSQRSLDWLVVAFKIGLILFDSSGFIFFLLFLCHFFI